MSKLRLRIFDGTRLPFATPTSFLITIFNGIGTQLTRDFHPENDLTFDLPFYDNATDNFRVIVFTDNYRQAGYQPVKLSEAYLTTLDIMLVPNNPGFNFAPALWPNAKAAYPFLASHLPDPAAQQRYDDLLDRHERSLASFLNLAEAMSQIALPQGTPLDYIKQLRWEPPYYPAQDRFFAWCDVALIDQVKRATAAGHFAPEFNPGLFHPGATSSYKQIQFGEANVQLTFHENDTTTIDGVPCVMVEPDMDYYKDTAAHIVLELLPNALEHMLTDPVMVYMLRWIAGRTAGIPDFVPLYTITS